MNMDFRSTDPGAVQYGNFINYYQFNSADERINLLPENLWLSDMNKQTGDEPYLVLDVGCNAGNLTQLLWKYLIECIKGPVFILGIDIDPMLIKRCRAHNAHVDFVTYKCLDVMDNGCENELQQYLSKFKRRKFDAICCFSITMWIHLNHNDIGLQHFLRKLTDHTELFVVEPQPWKCYKTAKQRLNKYGEIFPLLKELQWRLNVASDIENYIETELKCCKVYESSQTKWKRKICFYRKKRD